MDEAAACAAAWSAKASGTAATDFLAKRLPYGTGYRDGHGKQ